ncbi:hypothetical protein OW763_07075 [Clostridium aestuarii]|uniref:Lipoprotein n=1 Tax=Clostridium aestuarii TaxID=338193 RepID=A0ABT4CYQ6_9CLOT|nr:hypothetical protein [Clostridium aestuarii]MCY6484114.1 hypothetical protein [Clostridium aestuarii]
MNKSKKIFALKIGIPVILAVGCISITWIFNTKTLVASDKTVVVCEDASELNISDDKPLQIVQRRKIADISGLHDIFGFNEKNQAIVGIGLGKEEFEKKYKDKKRTEMSDEENDEAYNDIHGKLYKFDLETLKKIPLKNGKDIVDAEDVTAGFSPDKTKFEYTFNKKQYIYDIKNDTSKSYYNREMCGVWSQDGNFIINRVAFGSNESSNNLYVYDVKNNIIKKIHIDDKVFVYCMNFYSEDGKKIYFLGEQSKEDNVSIRIQGIFKVNIDTEKVEPVMLLPYFNNKKGSRRNKNRIYDDYNLIDGEKKIIFEGRLNEEDGIFIYDIESKRFHKLIASPEKGVAFSYWLSPDKAKVIYTISRKKGNKRFWNLYGAKISGNKLINRISLCKDIDLGGIVANMIQWSSNSKKIIFFEQNSEYNKNDFNISDRNIINMITFK